MERRERNILTDRIIFWNKVEKTESGKERKGISSLSEPISSLLFYKEVLPPLNKIILFLLFLFFHSFYIPFFLPFIRLFLPLSFLYLVIASVSSIVFSKFKLKYQS